MLRTPQLKLTDLFFIFEVTRCSVPLTSLPGIWQPTLFIKHLKEENKGALDILELNTTAGFNVNRKSISDITISCPMNFAKFPFDDQKCAFRMILDETLDFNVTLRTKKIALPFQMFGHGFKPSEQSYRYKV